MFKRIAIKADTTAFLTAEASLQKAAESALNKHRWVVGPRVIYPREGGYRDLAIRWASHDDEGSVFWDSEARCWNSSARDNTRAERMVADILNTEKVRPDELLTEEQPRDPI